MTVACVSTPAMVITRGLKFRRSSAPVFPDGQGVGAFASVSLYTPGGTMISTSLVITKAASWTAARSVHVAAAVAHLPSPGDTSTASRVLLTVNGVVTAAAGPAPASAKSATASERAACDARRGDGIAGP